LLFPICQGITHLKHKEPEHTGATQLSGSKAHAIKTYYSVRQ
jgi:hypothetical protein